MIVDICFHTGNRSPRQLQRVMKTTVVAPSLKSATLVIHVVSADGCVVRHMFLMKEIRDIKFTND